MLDKLIKREILIIIAIAVILFTNVLKLENGQVVELTKENREVEQVVEVKQVNSEVLVSAVPIVAEEVINELEKAMKQGVEADTKTLLNKLMEDGYTLDLEGVDIEEIYEEYRIVGISFGDKKVTVENKQIKENIGEV